MIGGEPARPRIERRRLAGLGEPVRGQDRAAELGFLDQAAADDQALGRGIGKADCNAVGRRLGVEGQPGGARFRDRDLGGQKLGAARHPQSDDVAGTDPAPDQAARERVGAGIEVGIARAFAVEDEGGMPGPGRGARAEQVGQHLLAEKVGPVFAA
jgi:hypothetical protein